MPDNNFDRPTDMPKPEQAEGEQIAKPEQEVGLDGLMAFAQEQVTEQLSETEQLQERAEELH
ncbi:MAG: hypothetical protein A3I92_00810 [Candidatus Yanofskybacteria bacterium RIFCSPLOWO2_02_FULL_43_10b]|uniref:Uncharacterized protein n=1 Tax=Candidatus Yanofskybacteria bacterium RIFCSPLOWO2_02_FULL_43_10b TaxID=1802704 RepID=A0A1F8H5E7_9BACT|nr:MAG: hypothetical protein A3I92_00810 [Candidatus Yanofskybacteria bacterium RIFCSPLOWO2_02_FULL_43_10b]